MRADRGSRLELHGFVEICQRLVEIALGVISPGAIVISRDQLMVELQRLAIIGDGAIEIVLGLICLAPAQEGGAKLASFGLQNDEGGIHETS